MKKTLQADTNSPWNQKTLSLYMNWVKSRTKNSDICNFDRLPEKPQIMLGVLFAFTPKSILFSSVQTWVLCLLQVNSVEMG